MQVAQAQLFEVGDLRLHAFEAARPEVGVADASEHLVRGEPVGRLLALCIQTLQVGGPLAPAVVGRVQQVLDHLLEVRPLAVQVGQLAHQPRTVHRQPFREGGPVGLGAQGLGEAVFDAVEHGVKDGLRS